MRAILHVDMDAFFASVEQKDDPRLRGKPVLVGGASRRGVVAAASYEARVFGARSAMPMHEALRLCPNAIVVPPRRERYEEESRAVFDVFYKYTPLVEGLSVDEAFLDVTGSRGLFGDGVTIARAIRKGVFESTGLTASAGVARCKFAAKIASDMNKPDGLTVVPDDVAAFLAPLPIERMWGVGVKTGPKLRALGLRTLGDLAKASPALLTSTLGSWGAEVRRLAVGDDPRDVDPSGVAKSVGAESTYETDLTTRAEIEHALLEHASRIAQRLTATGLRARTITTKLKYADFSLLSRRVSLPEPICDTQSIHEAAKSLLDRFPLDRARVRLVGISTSGFDKHAVPTLFPDRAAEKRRALEDVILRAKDRYGDDRVTRASLLDDATRVVVPQKERV